MLASFDRIVRGSTCGLLLMAAVALSAGAPAYADTFSCTVNTLLGINETPSNNSPALGLAFLNLDTGANTVDSLLLVLNLTTGATAAHIHLGAAGVAGPVKVPLSLGTGAGQPTFVAPAPGNVPVAGFHVSDIAATPTNFYVNVHSSTFAGGEIRGQLIACANQSTTTTTTSTTGTTGTTTGGGATPELDSILLLGSGLAGIGGYGLLRLRAARRQDATPPDSEK